MEGYSGYGGATLEQAIVQQAAHALAARYQCDLVDGYQHLSALAHERDSSLTETARAVLGEGGGRRTRGPELFDPSRYLRPPHPAITETRQPPPVEDLPSPPDWVDSVLAAVHVNGMYCVPLRDEGEIVDFVVARTNDKATQVAAPGTSLVGRRLLDINPNVLATGLFHQYLHAYETGEPFARGPFEYVGVHRGRFEPSIMTVKAVRAGPGLLVTWSLHPEEDKLLARWRQSERLAGLGWGEWNLFTDEIVWTRRMYDIFGRDPVSGPVRLDEMPALVLPEDLPDMEEAVRTLFEHREAVSGEYRILQRSGIRHVHMMLEPVLDSDALPVAVRMLAQDTTERRRRERRLAATQQRMLDEHRRAEEERRFSLRLREVIQPSLRYPVSLPRVVVTVRYLAAERIGGDWHKARVLPDGRVLLAIGDAMGHGLAAATLMAQTRAGLAGLAYTGASADRLLSWLNELVRSQAAGDVATGTAVLCHFVPDRRELCWACAGHPAPILVRGTTARLLEGEPGPLLGVVEDAEYALGTVALEIGDVLLFYTDGIVDRRDLDLDTATARLLEAAARSAGSLDDRLDAIVKAVGADQVEDDVCLMAAWVR
ncbi:MAG TPA: SpoIIE family protein phosphatase [Thermomonospora sp.]|nr:SpoIIE family protein phosphatase [Thermomonospora sp.]